MTAPILLRDDFDGLALRLLARRSRDANQARRLLALAEISSVIPLKAVPPHFDAHDKAPAPNFIMRRSSTSERTLTLAKASHHHGRRCGNIVILHPRDRRCSAPV